MHKLLISKIILVTFLIINIHPSNAAIKVAKVIIIKGKAIGQLPGGKKSQVKRGDWIVEGTTLATAKKSFVKLLFTDKSSVNIGPKSQMTINKFAKGSAGILSVFKGKIRAKVTKDLVNGKGGQAKSKMFVKTRTAAMGVRGTDFSVSYNPHLRTTALVTYSGRVAMAKINAKALQNVVNIRARMEKIVNSKLAVRTRAGTFAGASAKVKRASIPVKISPAQLQMLKRGDFSGKKSRAIVTKTYRAVIPKGVNSKTFAHSSEGIAKQLASVVDRKILSNVKKQAIANGNGHGAPPPQGFYNKSTGAYAPAAGGFVDMKSGLYIPPDPKTAQYDPVTKTYIPASNYGSVSSDGSYRPPIGYSLDETTGEFTRNQGPRELASNNGGAGDEPPPLPPVLGEPGKPNNGPDDTPPPPPPLPRCPPKCPPNPPTIESISDRAQVIFKIQMGS